MNEKTVFNEVYKERFGRTICEVHREMYDIMYEQLRLHPKYDELTTKLDEAYQMAKKMDAKLRQYKNNYDDGWWEKERELIIKQKLIKRENRHG